MKDQFLWVEKYRPKTIDDCILPDKLKQTFINQSSSIKLVWYVLSIMKNTEVEMVLISFWTVE